MKPLHGGRTFDQQMKHHLADGRAPEFDVGQPGRVDLARMFIEKILHVEPRRPFRIIELGCGAGDVSGPYSSGVTYVTTRGPIDTHGIEVIGVDVTPAAAAACARRYPRMTFHLSPVELLPPVECDLLVMTEFLEHVADPLKIVKEWMPLARWALIGHPLDEPDPPIEAGHAWSYSVTDWANWFTMNKFQVWERVIFPMGSYPNMVIGHGSRQ